MTAAALVVALREAGIRLRVVAGRLDLEGPNEPPGALLEELMQRREEVLALLAERAAPPPPVRVVDRREETAAPVVAPEPDEPLAGGIVSARPVTAGEVVAASGRLPPGFGVPRESPLPCFVDESIRDFRNRAGALLGINRR